jgi:hypothetical protein
MTNDEIVAIVAHDAGGAEILSSFQRRMLVPTLLVIEGPARRVFERKLGPVQTVSLDEAIDRGSWVLCGTSWQSDLEWRATELARRSGKRCVAYLDHWVNYRERFEREGELRLPDAIWVADLYAMALAKKSFPHAPIRLMGNPYFDDVLLELQRTELRRSAKPSGATVLYICEPIGEHALIQLGNERQMGYVEDEAVQYFFHNLRLISDRILRVVMRPHPSEPEGKYSWVLGVSPVPIQISSGGSLIDDLAQADVVVGCESMAMVIALLARKRVVCSIPPGGRPCALPYPGIELLHAMVETKAS